jgi:anti-sigma factor RsiW
MSTPLTCQHLVELVTEYLEGALSPDDTERFETHIAGCVNCRTYVEQMRYTITTLGHLTENDIPQPVQTELLNVFRDWKRTH